MRCISIAEAFRTRGETCQFILSSKEMSSLIIGKGYESIILNTEYNILTFSIEQPLLEKTLPSAIIVDSYYVTKEYLAELYSWCELHESKLVYIDDLKKTPYMCDILIDYQIHASEEEYNSMYRNYKRPRLLIGLNYVPLRAEFNNLPDRVVKKKVERILVTTGGADPKHILVALMNRSCDLDLDFHIVVGSQNKDLRILKQLAKDHPRHFLHIEENNMSQLMRECDIAISAAGTTLYELCATQTPVITFSTAYNQISIAKAFSDYGIAEYCGDVESKGINTLLDIVLQRVMALSMDYEIRKRRAQLMKRIVDGRGTERICDAIMVHCEENCS